MTIDARSANADLAAIRGRAKKATPGPWRWAQDDENNRIAPVGKDGERHPKSRLRETWLMLLIGAGRTGVAEGWRDIWDYHHVFGLKWGALKVETLFNATPNEADAEFIAHARTDVPALIARIEELRAVLKKVLDDPMHGEPSSCVFCHASEYERGGPPDYSLRRAEPVPHHPDCPTRHADRLLGRA